MVTLSQELNLKKWIVRFQFSDFHFIALMVITYYLFLFRINDPKSNQYRLNCIILWKKQNNKSQG